MSNNQEVVGGSVACLGYVFLSFCSFTDGDLSDEEMEAIKVEILGISNAFRLSEEEYSQAIDDAVTMLMGCSDSKEQMELFIKVLDLLSSQDYWNQGLAEAVVGSLIRMMDADGERHENEIYWVNQIKKVWKVA
jgi:uncharacterized tellurite resistance protein B-like protein